MKGSVQHLNPNGLHKNPAYSQAVAVAGNGKTVYVGGQNAVDASGRVVGKDNLQVQTEQVLKNVETALAAGGAKLEHVVKWNVYIVQGQSVLSGFKAFRHAWGDRPNPPAVTVLFVAGLANPDFLVEIDAIAVVPEEWVPNHALAANRWKAHLEQKPAQEAGKRVWYADYQIRVARVERAYGKDHGPNKAPQWTAARRDVFDVDMKLNCQSCIGKSGSAAVTELGR